MNNMAESFSSKQILDLKAVKRNRKSYGREEKLKTLKFYWDNGHNLYKTTYFSLNTKTVLRWIEDEEKIWSSSKRSKWVKFERKAM